VTPFCSRPVKPGYQGTARPRPLTRGLLSSQGNRAFHGIWCNGYREVSLSRSSPPLTSSRLSSPPLASHPLPSPGPPTFFFLQLLKLIEKTQTQTALTIANCQLPTANCQLPSPRADPRYTALHRSKSFLVAWHVDDPDCRRASTNPVPDPDPDRCWRRSVPYSRSFLRALSNQKSLSRCQK
jgi:hypothetical protein